MPILGQNSISSISSDYQCILTTRAFKCSQLHNVTNTFLHSGATPRDTLSTTSVRVFMQPRTKQLYRKPLVRTILRSRPVLTRYKIHSVTVSVSTSMCYSNVRKAPNTMVRLIIVPFPVFSQHGHAIFLLFARSMYERHSRA